MQFPIIQDLAKFEREILEGDNSANYANRAMEIVKKYIDHQYTSVGLEPPAYHLYTPWFNKSDQFWKATVSTNLPDGMYYEVSYNAGEKRTVLTAYKALDTVVTYD